MSVVSYPMDGAEVWRPVRPMCADIGKAAYKLSERLICVCSPARGELTP